MHFLIAALGLLGAGAFWWYRMRALHDAGKDISGTLTKAGKQYRAGQQAHLASLKPLLDVDDPLVMTATLALAITCEGKPVPPRVEKRLLQLLSRLPGAAGVDSALVEAKRLQAKTSRVGEAVDLLASRLAAKLTPPERGQVLDIVQETFTASPSRPAHVANHIVRLKQRLELS